jgi:hypothetical protein
VTGCAGYRKVQVVTGAIVRVQVVQVNMRMLVIPGRAVYCRGRLYFGVQVIKFCKGAGW